MPGSLPVRNAGARPGGSAGTGRAASRPGAGRGVRAAEACRPERIQVEVVDGGLGMAGRHSGEADSARILVGTGPWISGGCSF